MAVTERQAARAIILTDAHEVLLMRMAFPWLEEDLWILPGGGIEHGETPAEAVEREIFEETGARGLVIGPVVWHREFLVEATATLMRQRYLLVQGDRFQPVASSLLGAEADWLREYRWWSLPELHQTPELNVEPDAIAAGIQQLIVDLADSGRPAPPVAIDLLSA